MKNRPFLHRAHFAFQGIRAAFRSEASFRMQSFFALGALALLLVLKPRPIWWALLALTIGSVLAAELVNTSIEHIADRLHPEQHPMIARAKDCAAGAVLVLSLASLAIAAALVVESVRG